MESLGKKLDEVPGIQAAEQAVQRARDELEKTLNYYRRLRDQAAETGEQVKDKNVGDCLGDVLRYVSRHPVQGVLLAGLAGFFLGRWIRR